MSNRRLQWISPRSRISQISSIERITVHPQKKPSESKTFHLIEFQTNRYLLATLVHALADVVYPKSKTFSAYEFYSVERTALCLSFSLSEPKE